MIVIELCRSIAEITFMSTPAASASVAAPCRRSCSRSAGARLARAFGPISAGAAWTIGKLGGGHRHGTHSFIGIGVFTALAIAATHNVWTLTFTVWLCIGLGVRALWKRPANRPNGKLDYRDIAGLLLAAVAAYVAYQLVHSKVDMYVVPWAIGIGYVVRLIDDSMTEMGVNWLWPHLKR